MAVNDGSTAGGGSPGGSLGSIDVVGAASDSQSEDQILAGTDAEAGSSDVAEIDDTPVGQTDDAKTDDDQGSTDGEGDLAGKTQDGKAAEVAAPLTIPKELTSLLKDPAVAPKLQAVMPKIQAAFDQNAKFREVFPTVAEARAMREVFPGGAEEAKAVAAKAVALDEADDQFSSADPQEQQSLASEWFEDNPEAFRSMFMESAKLLQARDPQSYQEITGSILTSQFQANRWDEQLEAMRVAIEGNDLERLKGLSSWLVNEADKKGIRFNRDGRVSQESQALNRDRENLSREQSQAQTERVEFFNERVNSAVGSQVKAAVSKALTPLLEKSAFTDKGKERISKEVFEEIDRRLKADKSITRAFRQIIRPNGKLNLTRDAQAQASNLLVGKARAVLTSVAKAIIQERTAEMISANRTTNSKKDAAGKRADVSGGASPQVRTRKLTPKDVAGMSDDEILNM